MAGPGSTPKSTSERTRLQAPRALDTESAAAAAAAPGAEDHGKVRSGFDEERCRELVVLGRHVGGCCAQRMHMTIAGNEGACHAGGAVNAPEVLGAGKARADRPPPSDAAAGWGQRVSRCRSVCTVASAGENYLPTCAPLLRGAIDAKGAPRSSSANVDDTILAPSSSKEMAACGRNQSWPRATRKKSIAKFAVQT
jgi:hypothetical protein